MRKISFILVFCLLFIYMQFPLVTEANENINSVRVGLSYGSVTEAWFSSNSNIDLFDARYMSYITTIPADTSFKIAVSGSALTGDYFSPTNSSIRMESSSPISFGGKKYRGVIEVSNVNNSVVVVNDVNMEDYLASVLGREMNEKWPMEALKAQSVCARNYVMSVTKKHASYGFDVCSTTDCQVYGGVDSEAERTRQAVRETSGVIVTYQGEAVPLFYFSCDGGRTESSENVWNEPLGYVRGKVDYHEREEYATLYSWTKALTKGEIENILNSKNMGVGSLRDIRVESVSENGGVTKLTFVGTAGEKTVTKTQTRTVLSLNSQAYTIEKKAYSTPTRTETEVVERNVLTSEGVVKVTNPSYALTGDGIEEITYKTIEVPVEATSYDEYVFSGHGWGHLVGMSQWGAFSMAQDGYTYRDILNFYYTDIEIVELKVEESEEETEDEAEVEEEETEEVEDWDDSFESEDEEWEDTEEDTENEDTQWSDTGI